MYLPYSLCFYISTFVQFLLVIVNFWLAKVTHLRQIINLLHTVSYIYTFNAEFTLDLSVNMKCLSLSQSQKWPYAAALGHANSKEG